MFKRLLTSVGSVGSPKAGSKPTEAGKAENGKPEEKPTVNSENDEGDEDEYEEEIEESDEDSSSDDDRRKPPPFDPMRAMMGLPQLSARGAPSKPIKSVAATASVVPNRVVPAQASPARPNPSPSKQTQPVTAPPKRVLARTETTATADGGSSADEGQKPHSGGNSAPSSPDKSQRNTSNANTESKSSPEGSTGSDQDLESDSERSEHSRDSGTSSQASSDVGETTETDSSPEKPAVSQSGGPSKTATGASGSKSSHRPPSPKDNSSVTSSRSLQFKSPGSGRINRRIVTHDVISGKKAVQPVVDQAKIDERARSSPRIAKANARLKSLIERQQSVASTGTDGSKLAPKRVLVRPPPPNPPPSIPLQGVLKTPAKHSFPAQDASPERPDARQHSQRGRTESSPERQEVTSPPHRGRSDSTKLRARDSSASTSHRRRITADAQLEALDSLLQAVSSQMHSSPDKSAKRKSATKRKVKIVRKKTIASRRRRSSSRHGDGKKMRSYQSADRRVMRDGQQFPLPPNAPPPRRLDIDDETTFPREGHPFEWDLDSDNEDRRKFTQAPVPVPPEHKFLVPSVPKHHDPDIKPTPAIVSVGEYEEADNIVDALTPREQHLSDDDSMASPPPQRSSTPQQQPPQSVKLQPQVMAGLSSQIIEDQVPKQVSEDDLAPKLTVGTAVQPTQPFPRVYTKPPASCGMLALRGFSLVHIVLTIASSIAVSSLVIGENVSTSPSQHLYAQFSTMVQVTLLVGILALWMSFKPTKPMPFLAAAILVAFQLAACALVFALLSKCSAKGAVWQCGTGTNSYTAPSVIIRTVYALTIVLVLSQIVVAGLVVAVRISTRYRRAREEKLQSLKVQPNILGAQSSSTAYQGLNGVPIISTPQASHNDGRASVNQSNQVNVHVSASAEDCYSPPVIHTTQPVKRGASPSVVVEVREPTVTETAGRPFPSVWSSRHGNDSEDDEVEPIPPPVKTLLAHQSSSATANLSRRSNIGASVPATSVIGHTRPNHRLDASRAALHPWGTYPDDERLRTQGHLFGQV